MLGYLLKTEYFLGVKLYIFELEILCGSKKFKLMYYKYNLK